ncbi:SNF2 family N-terminal domain-domain-containing protein [Lobosporangium transversale]|uniref:SNF2 family N-terminal domain-domain-containing protein n=1 Tax=Lobosporangium transversale TaxID=64571 RepID=A0A1Y2GJZ4_9FUNG|nr:SNF2 family N-terminal domain-domain-containing protein [Lobosporangium transversale]ORZ13350.1 SNF2 family N-terminal domain-domain-containing protein [Lobosporangium transversale]|eukprot:XP_021880431.1 SNF2 family N-terminal domain-domain-containing protein [Lobosporangium transversale]
MPATKFKSPFAPPTPVEASGPVPQPRHNPNAPYAILLPRPPRNHPRVIKGCGNKRSPGDIGLVDVVIDPVLGQHLRPHQKEGVQFLYECVMQMKNFHGQGAILADEMGLGKTLQTITLIWTLLKQSPYYGEESCVIKKALIVCPASLIKNWQKEFKKWLGIERLRVFAVDSKSTMTDFTLGKIYPVMIIGYEKLRTVQDELVNTNFDIIVCDEGHRLKTSNIKTAQVIRSFSTMRRIILSGTPIQNDLGELFSMIDFVNPGLFENYSSFKRVFEDPIVKSRQPDCSSSDALLGLERYLTRLTNQFILRRTAQVSYEFLPRKSEFVIFCRPSPLQCAMYRHILDSPYLQNCFSMESSRYLACITVLRKLCNSPKLVLEQAKVSNRHALFQDKSRKLSFVEALLKSIKRNTTERVVLVSNFTQTLDLLEGICTRYHFSFFRLDGSTPTSKRQEYVDKFNAPNCRKFVFLLSAKSGGLGLNLIGASRLIMFDIDWNPSVDLQAMARIYRDGQTRPVYIYRLLSSGTIEEKIYQRQLTKVGLCDSLMDGKTSEKLNKFSIEELKDLFTFHEDEPCLTHTLLGCDCHTVAFPHSPKSKGTGRTQQVSKNGTMSKTSTSFAKKELEEWTHLNIELCRSFALETEVFNDSEILMDINRYINGLADKDKILWFSISDDERDDTNNNRTIVKDDVCLDSTVAFVFLRVW